MVRTNLSAADARPVMALTELLPRLILNTSYAERIGHMSTEKIEERRYRQLTDEYEIHQQLTSLDLQPVILSSKKLQLLLIDFGVARSRLGRSARDRFRVRPVLH